MARVRHPARRGDSGAGIATTNTQNGSYTFILSDGNNIVFKASGGAGETYTIPANATVAYDVGTLIAITNDGGDDLTIAITTDTMEGTDGNTGSRTLTNNNSATVEKITTTKWRYTSTDSAGSSSASPEYASFYCATGVNTGIGGLSEQQQTLDSTLINSDTGIFVLANDGVTVNKTAHFKLTYDSTIRQRDDTSNVDSSIGIWIDIDAVQIAGSLTYFFTQGYNRSNSATMTLITPITSGEEITLAWIGSTGVTDLQEVDNGCRFTIEEMV